MAKQNCPISVLKGSLSVNLNHLQTQLVNLIHNCSFWAPPPQKNKRHPQTMFSSPSDISFDMQTNLQHFQMMTKWKIWVSHHFNHGTINHKKFDLQP